MTDKSIDAVHNYCCLLSQIPPGRRCDYCILQLNLGSLMKVIWLVSC